jgi:hypothetical protein
VGIVEGMSVDKKAVKRLVNDEVVGLARFNSLLHARTHPGGLTFCGATIVLDVEFKHNRLWLY